ncbi:MAG: hypothetical protein IJB77_08295, partial [Bacteroidaceae bacterium]|nr:hypothetical protein [Bacteroidaceae bacterium]
MTKKTDSKGETTYTYDDTNKLTAVQTATKTTTYEYDAVGNRTKETTGTIVKEYIYNAKNQLTTLIEKD